MTSETKTATDDDTPRFLKALPLIDINGDVEKPAEISHRDLTDDEFQALLKWVDHEARYANSDA